MHKVTQSYFEASARQRIHGIADKSSFSEICGPEERQTSPSLGYFDLPIAFDDGVVIGDAAIKRQPVAIVAQEGKFMGGAFGEVHSAKIIGLLKRSLRKKPTAVVLLLDSGGVRLQEANAGEIGVSEIIRAIFDVQAAGIPVIGVIGGSTGCFGGAGILSGCCDVLIGSENGRIGVSGPEVIETNMGIEAFDSRDRALVWRTTGGKNRYLFDILDTLVDDDIPSFRDAIANHLSVAAAHDESPIAECTALQQRATAYAQYSDALSIWHAMGIEEAEQVPALSTVAMIKLKTHLQQAKQ